MYSIFIIMYSTLLLIAVFLSTYSNCDITSLSYIDDIYIIEHINLILQINGLDNELNNKLDNNDLKKNLINTALCEVDPNEVDPNEVNPNFWKVDPVFWILVGNEGFETVEAYEGKKTRYYDTVYKDLDYKDFEYNFRERSKQLKVPMIPSHWEGKWTAPNPDLSPKGRDVIFDGNYYGEQPFAPVYSKRFNPYKDEWEYYSDLKLYRNQVLDLFSNLLYNGKVRPEDFYNVFTSEDFDGVHRPYVGRFVSYAQVTGTISIEYLNWLRLLHWPKFNDLGHKAEINKEYFWWYQHHREFGLQRFNKYCDGLEIEWEDTFLFNKKPYRDMLYLINFRNALTDPDTGEKWYAAPYTEMDWVIERFSDQTIYNPQEGYETRGTSCIVHYPRESRGTLVNWLEATRVLHLNNNIGEHYRWWLRVGLDEVMESTVPQESIKMYCTLREYLYDMLPADVVDCIKEDEILDRVICRGTTNVEVIRNPGISYMPYTHEVFIYDFLKEPWVFSFYINIDFFEIRALGQDFDCSDDDEFYEWDDENLYLYVTYPYLDLLGHRWLVDLFFHHDWEKDGFLYTFNNDRGPIRFGDERIVLPSYGMRDYGSRHMRIQYW